MTPRPAAERASHRARELGAATAKNWIASRRKFGSRMDPRLLLPSAMRAPTTALEGPQKTCPVQRRVTSVSDHRRCPQRTGTQAGVDTYAGVGEGGGHEPPATPAQRRRCCSMRACTNEGPFALCNFWTTRRPPITPPRSVSTTPTALRWICSMRGVSLPALGIGMHFVCTTPRKQR